MQTLIRRQSHKAGLPPGSLVPMGDTAARPVRISAIDYDQNTYNETVLDGVNDCIPYKTSSTTSWINVDGVHNADLIKSMGECFDLHALTLEDIMNTDHRPKVEDFGHYIFITLKMLYLSGPNDDILFEQVSLVLGQGYVLSFQEAQGDVFQTVRERIQRASGRLRQRGPGYLAYALVDAVVDQYFLILESLGEEIETLEEYVVQDSDRIDTSQIYGIKREVTLLRRSVWPLREMVSTLEKIETDLIDETTQVFVRDLHDHSLAILDTIDTFRDMAGNILDVHLTNVNNRMNQVMKLLTIIATIFIPLTFIAGIYGMNFDYMPELKWQYSYFIIWGIMLVLALAMVKYFKNKKWL
jgi:magnesium transporter